MGIFQARILEWSPHPPPGDLANPGVEPRSPALPADSSASEPLRTGLSSVQFSSVVSSCLQLHGLQHIRLPCPSPTPGAYSNSCPLNRDAIQPSHPLWPPSPPAFNLSQNQESPAKARVGGGLLQGRRQSAAVHALIF